MRIWAAAAIASTPLVARAQVWTKNAGGDASGSWSTPQNWNNGAGPVAGGAGSVADFGTLNITSTSTVTLDGDRTVGSVIFGDTTPTPGSPVSWILAPGAPATSTLTLNNPIGTPTISVRLDTAGTGGTATISAPIAGTQGFTKDGLRTLILSSAPGSSTFSGTFGTGQGAIELGQDDQIGDVASAFASTQGKIYANGHNDTFANLTVGPTGNAVFSTGSASGPGAASGSNVINVTGTVTLKDASRLNIVSGATVVAGKGLILEDGIAEGGGVLRLGGDVFAGINDGANLGNGALDLNGATRTFFISDSPTGLLVHSLIDAQPGGAGGVLKIGKGRMEIAQASYAGPTTVNEGNLVIGSVATPSSPLTLGGGTLQVATATFGGPQFTLNRGGGSILVEGGTLTLPDNWARSGGASLFIDLGQAGGGAGVAATLSSKPLAPVANAGPTTPVLGYAWVKDAGGVGFAYVNGAGNVARYTAATPLAASTASPVLTLDASTNYAFTLDGNFVAEANGDTSPLAANSLVVTAIGAAGTREINFRNHSLALRTGGLIVSTPQDVSVLFSSNRLGAPDAELLLHKQGRGELILGSGTELTGGTGSVVIDGDVDLLATGDGPVRIDGNISTFSGGMTLGPGATTIVGASTVFNGNTPVSGPFGVGPLTIKGGLLGALDDVLPVRLGNPLRLASDMRIVAGSPIRFEGPTTLERPSLIIASNIGAGGLTFAASIGEAVPGSGVTFQSGTVTLSAANTYTGLTRFSSSFISSTLTLNGSVAGSVLMGGGTLRGTGTVGGDLTLDIGSTLAPGNGPGTLRVNGNLSARSSSFQFEIADTTSYDRIDAAGAATTLSTRLDLSTSSGYVPKVGDAFFVLTQGGTASPGEFLSRPEGSQFAINGIPFAITYQANWTGSPATSSLIGGNDVALYAVPEPAAGAAAVVAAAALAVRRRKRA